MFIRRTMLVAVILLLGVFAYAPGGLAQTNINEFDPDVGLVGSCGVAYYTVTGIAAGTSCDACGGDAKCSFPITSWRDSFNGTCKIVSVSSNECGICDALAVFTRAAHFLLASLGGIAAIFFLWGGVGLIFNWGNEEKIQGAKKTLVGTLIGVAIVLLSWTLVNIVVGILTADAGTQSPNFSKVLNPWFTPDCGRTPGSS